MSRQDGNFVLASYFVDSNQNIQLPLSIRPTIVFDKVHKCKGMSIDDHLLTMIIVDRWAYGH